MITGNSARTVGTRHPAAAGHFRPAPAPPGTRQAWGHFRPTASNGRAPISGGVIIGNDLPIRGR
jgi:hypothetical protein